VRYHDFHLEGYTVAQYGTEIVLHLVWNYEGMPRETSQIRFADVAAYLFVHTGGAIVTHIESVPIAEILGEFGDQLAEWRRRNGGYLHWDDDRARYAEALVQRHYRAWRIESAIGFEGFVIAKTVQQVPDPGS
jgi:hypothetical protein